MMTSTSGCCALTRFEQIHPAHARHEHVDQHHVDRARFEQRQRGLAIFGGQHVETDAHEHAREAAPNIGLVVDEQAPGLARSFGLPRRRRGQCARGRMDGARGRPERRGHRPPPRVPPEAPERGGRRRRRRRWSACRCSPAAGRRRCGCRRRAWPAAARRRRRAPERPWCARRATG